MCITIWTDHSKLKWLFIYISRNIKLKINSDDLALPPGWIGAFVKVIGSMSVISKSVYSTHGVFRYQWRLNISESTWTPYLAGLLALAIFTRGYWIFVANINWDEFYYLSFVHQYLNGNLTRQLQVFHVHFFEWLPAISENEANQIIAARVVMLALQLLTALFLLAIARRFFRVSGALFAVLCYACFSFTIQHGTSFRFDPIITCLLIASLYLLLRPAKSIVQPIVAGLLISTAALVSIKSIFYMPIFGAVILIQTLNSNRIASDIKYYSVTVCSALLGLGTLYIYHGTMIDSDASLISLVAQDGMVQQGFRKTILFDNPFPRFAFLKQTLLADFAIWAAIFTGLFITIRNILTRSTGKKAQWWILAAMPLPLLTLLFYRNAYPYYYVFMMAPASLLAGAAFEELVSIKKSDLACACIRVPLILFAVSLTAFGIVKPSMYNLFSQRNMLSVIHQTFPEKIPYIDRSSMVSSFPKIGIFMSSWGLENYFMAGEPVLKKAIKQNQPKFLLANSPYLDVPASSSQINAGDPIKLLAADDSAIRNNFIPHWGQLYIAGKTFSLAKAAPPEQFELYIEGPYTIEGSDVVWIDDKPLRPGVVVDLKRGRHKIQSKNISQPVSLRWGSNSYRPDLPTPAKPLFAGF